MTEPPTPARFSSYDEFFDFYLRAHSHPGNRVLHFCGSLLGLALVIAAFALGHPWYALLYPVIGYGFAWFGHFVIEGNKPATFGHPGWSFISDYRMVWLMATGQLGARMKRIDSGKPV
ncbi:MAG TPA: DUF962 domain-containing protein [Lacipirellulaceae bacterium]|nr:DUF962 domain-containing protein [Lacipirellulaceae bacterium]